MLNHETDTPIFSEDNSILSQVNSQYTHYTNEGEAISRKEDTSINATSSHR